jgi:hypothetical protein
MLIQISQLLFLKTNVVYEIENRGDWTSNRYYNLLLNKRASSMHFPVYLYGLPGPAVNGVADLQINSTTPGAIVTEVESTTKYGRNSVVIKVVSTPRSLIDLK